MTCDCRANIEAALTEQHKKREPEATGHGARLEGYATAINFTTGDVVTRPGMPYKVSALHVAKTTGRESVKSKKGNMLFNFCPFCGGSLKAEVAP